MSLDQIRNNIPTADVWLANIFAISISLVNIKDILSIFSLLMAIGYSAWRWHRDYKKDK
jgi:hypothetical protein